MSFKFNKNRYYVEKLLPIKLININKYTAMSFKYNTLILLNKTQACSICLDLCDMHNKALLVSDINNNNNHLWFTQNNEKMSIDNLIICDKDSDVLNYKLSNIQQYDDQHYDDDDDDDDDDNKSQITSSLSSSTMATSTMSNCGSVTSMNAIIQFTQQQQQQQQYYHNLQQKRLCDEYLTRMLEGSRFSR